jgi:predicted PurR-regulated permease PerM
MAEPQHDPTAQGLRRSLAVTLTVAAVVLAFCLAYLLRAPLFYLFIGIVVATAMRPPIGWLAARGLPRQRQLPRYTDCSP